MGQFAATGMYRSFDLTVTKMKDDSTVTFAGLDKDEYKPLERFFTSKKVKVRNVDVD